MRFAALALVLATPAAAEVPVTMRHGYPMVPVEIAGQQREFVLDTGAEGSAVYPAFAAEMALPPAPTETLVGQTGEAEQPTRTVASIRFDGRNVGPISATELPARKDGLTLDGIVGLDVFGPRVLDLDIPRGRVALLDRDDAARVVAPLGKPVRARRVIGGLLAVPVALDGAEGWAVIDTGARETRVNAVFAARARLAADGRAETSVSGATQRAIAARSAAVRDASFLGQRRRDTSVRVIDLPVFAAFGLADQPAMLLGIDWLGAHRLVVDFAQGLVWLR